MPSEEFHRVLEVMRSMPRPDPWSVPVEQVRSGMELSTSNLPVPEGVRIDSVDAGGVPAEWVIPPGAPDGTTLLYLHGGGYCVGSPRTHRALVATFAGALGVRALSVDYRLAPEHPYPAARDDALGAFRWLRERGAPPGRIVVAGDSAGGGLSLALLLALRDAGDALPAAAVLLSPWTDLTVSAPSIHARADDDVLVQPEGLRRFAGFYAGATDLAAPAVSPLFADLAGLPPILVQVGTAECLFDDSTRLTEQLAAAGVDATLRVYEEMPHVFQILVMIPEAHAALVEAASFCRRHLAP